MRRRPKNQNSDSILYGEIETAVTAANYVEKATAWMKYNGGEGVVIRVGHGPNGWRHTGTRNTDAQWHAWLGYWGRLGLPIVFVAKHGLATAPAEWPEDFDLSADVSDRHWSPPFAPASMGRNFSPELLPFP